MKSLLLESLLPGIFFTILGLVMIIFRSRLAYWAVEENWKIFGVRFSKLGYKVSFFIGGVIFTLIGILTLFQIIRFK